MLSVFWVAQVDPGAVRATNDVAVLIRPENLDEAKRVMSNNGYHYRKAAGLDTFLEGKEDSVRYAIHIVLANQMVKESDYEANPDVEPSEYGDGIRTLPLERLVRMKLNSFRLKDRVHLLDLIEVGLLDRTWIGKFPKVLGDRLKQLIDNPDQ
jgi:hypothetical protein